VDYSIRKELRACSPGAAGAKRFGMALSWALSGAFARFQAVPGHSDPTEHLVPKQLCCFLFSQARAEPIATDAPQMPIMQRPFRRWTSLREVWIAAPCSAIPLRHRTKSRWRAPVSETTTGSCPPYLGTTGTHPPQETEPQGGLQHGSRQRSRKRLSTPALRAPAPCTPVLHCSLRSNQPGGRKPTFLLDRAR